VAELYAIVDHPHPSRAPLAAVADALLRGDGRRGARKLQLRAKTASSGERAALALELAPVCHAHGVTLVVNDDLAAACALARWAARGLSVGLHLGQGDPGATDVAGVRARAAAAGVERLELGLSTHDLGQLQVATAQRPDLLAFGPVRATGSKAAAEPPVGFGALLEAAQRAPRPLVAIGGLDADGARKAARLGVAWVAAIGALAGADVAACGRAAAALAEACEVGSRPLHLDEVAAAIPVLAPALLHDLAAWGDALSLQLQLGLPARFRPWLEGNAARYRPSDVLDLLYVLDKRADESWEQWRARPHPASLTNVVPLRRPGG